MSPPSRASPASLLLVAVLLLASAGAAASARDWGAGEVGGSSRAGGGGWAWGRGLLQASDGGSCDAEVAEALAKQKDLLEDRIVGGVEVKDPERFPYIANLVRYGVQEFCGGSLIAPNVVLTAAHCDKSRTTVWLGRYDLGEEESYEEFSIVEKAYPNPRWNPDTNDNDIMLLRLDGNSRFKPVAIDGGDGEPFVASVENERRRVEVTTMGWGATEWQGKRSNTLRKVTVNGFSRERCNSRDMYDGLITRNMVCAAAEGKDSCQGDSGGPLIVAKEEQAAEPDLNTCEDVLVGVVSWGARCAALEVTSSGGREEVSGYPGVYVRLANYKSFIDAALRQWGTSATYARKGSCTPAAPFGVTPSPTPRPAPTPRPTLPPTSRPPSRSEEEEESERSSSEEDPTPAPTPAPTPKPAKSSSDSDEENSSASKSDDDADEGAPEQEGDDDGSETEVGAQSGRALACSELPGHFWVTKALPICSTSRDKDAQCMNGFYTHADSARKCAEQGARLCSMTELIQQQAKDTGCGLNNVRIWTTSACGSGRHFMATGGTGSQIQCVSDAGWAFGTRCCGGSP